MTVEPKESELMGPKCAKMTTKRGLEGRLPCQLGTKTKHKMKNERAFSM